MIEGTSAPVASMDRHTSTAKTKQSTEVMKDTIKYECTCHVCGQTHKYKPSVAEKFKLETQSSLESGKNFRGSNVNK